MVTCVSEDSKKAMSEMAAKLYCLPPDVTEAGSDRTVFDDWEAPVTAAVFLSSSSTM